MTAAYAFDLPRDVAPAERTLPALLERQAARYPDRVLIVCDDLQLTYAETRRLAAASAQTLIEAGIGNGDRVALMMPNRLEVLQVVLGCAWLGAIAVPINVAARGPSLGHILRNSGARLLVVASSLVAPLAACIAESAPCPERFWIVEDGEPAEAPALPLHPMPLLGRTAAPAALRPGDPFAILYTSGTTGPAKGVICPHAQMFWWGVNTGRGLALRDGDVLFTALPLFHTNALNTFFQALLHGGTYAFQRKFSASAFWTRAREHGADVTYLLGAMAAILLATPESPDDKTHGIRVALGGGVPGRFHAPFMQRYGVPLLDGYGSTETNFVFASAVPPSRPGTMGTPVDGMHVRIVDAEDNDVQDGEAGELILRSQQPFAFADGYFGMPDKTVEAWRNLWFHTGDRVARDPDGQYRFVDRLKDTIRRRGENISSWDVEQALLAHPAIAACAAYPLPSELGEEEVAVAVQVAVGAVLAPLEIARFCEGRLPSFAIPRFVRFMTELPLTENGKVRKTVLRADGLVVGMWDREEAGYTNLRRR